MYTSIDVVFSRTFTSRSTLLLAMGAPVRMVH